MKEKTLTTPTNEIIARMDYILKYLDGIDPSYDSDEINAMIKEQQELWSSYDFFDQKFEENGHFGLKDIKGNLRIPALYADISGMYAYGTCVHDYPVPAVNDNGKTGLVGRQGKTVLDFLYDDLVLVDSYHFITRCDDCEGLIDTEGNIILPCEYDSVSEACGRVYVTEKDGKYGFYNDSDHGFTAPCIYDEIEENCDDIYVCYNGEWGFVATDGSFVPEDKRSETDVMSFVSCPF